MGRPSQSRGRGLPLLRAGLPGDHTGNIQQILEELDWLEK